MLYHRCLSGLEQALDLGGDTMTQHMVDISKQMSQVQLVVVQTPLFGIEDCTLDFQVVPEQANYMG